LVVRQRSNTPGGSEAEQAAAADRAAGRWAKISPPTPYLEEIKEIFAAASDADEIHPIVVKLADLQAWDELAYVFGSEFACRIAKIDGIILPPDNIPSPRKIAKVLHVQDGEHVRTTVWDRNGAKTDLATAALPKELARHPSRKETAAASAGSRPEPAAAASLDELLGQPAAANEEVAAIPARKVRRGRPLAMDEFHKGKLVGLMTYGLTFRQAAAMLGVDHKTVLNTMKRDAELAVEVADARLAAVARPLMKIIAESERSWRAATWLVKYLERRMAFAQEETPEERAERWENRDPLLKG
jgi:hypothetical protein